MSGSFRKRAFQLNPVLSFSISEHVHFYLFGSMSAAFKLLKELLPETLNLRLANYSWRNWTIMKESSKPHITLYKKKLTSFSTTDKPYCNAGIFCLCVLILGKIFGVIPGSVRFAGIPHWNITACFILLKACAVFKVRDKYTVGRDICLSSFKNINSGNLCEFSGDNDVLPLKL